MYKYNKTLNTLDTVLEYTNDDVNSAINSYNIVINNTDSTICININNKHVITEYIDCIEVTRIIAIHETFNHVHNEINIHDLLYMLDGFISEDQLLDIFNYTVII